MFYTQQLHQGDMASGECARLACVNPQGPLQIESQVQLKMLYCCLYLFAPSTLFTFGVTIQPTTQLTLLSLESIKGVLTT